MDAYQHEADIRGFAELNYINSMPVPAIEFYEAGKPRKRSESPLSKRVVERERTAQCLIKDLPARTLE